MGSLPIPGGSSSLNISGQDLEYEMHAPDDHNRTHNSSLRLCRYSSSFDGVGNVVPSTAVQDRRIQAALGDEASIMWLHSIRHGI